MVSLSVRKVTNHSKPKSIFKLTTATLALRPARLRCGAAISLPGFCFSCVGVSPTRFPKRKAQFICTKSENVFTAAWWSAITTKSGFMGASFSPQSELREGLLGLAPPYGLANPLLTSHCRMCVAPDIRVVLTWRHPLLPPRYERGSLLWTIEHRIGVALVSTLK